MKARKPSLSCIMELEFELFIGGVWGTVGRRSVVVGVTESPVVRALVSNANIAGSIPGGAGTIFEAPSF